MPEPTPRWGPTGILPSKPENLGEAAPRSHGEPGGPPGSQQRAANTSVREGSLAGEPEAGLPAQDPTQTPGAPCVCPDIGTAEGTLMALTEGQS